MSFDRVRLEGKCCACGGSLKYSKYLNGVTLDKQASWKNPVWGNVLVEGSSGRAVAFVCDQCLDEKRRVRFAVEFGKNGGIVYHPVGGLESVPSISEEDIRFGEKRR